MRSLTVSSLMASLQLFAANFSVADEPDPLYPPRTYLIPLTSKLPEPDAIEVAVISTDGIRIETEKTHSSQSLSSKQVATFTRLWRSQHWLYFDHSGTDDPRYRIRFFRHHSTFLEATLMRTTTLWDMVVRRSDLKFNGLGEAMFDINTPAGKELRSFMEKLRAKRANNSFKRIRRIHRECLRIALFEQRFRPRTTTISRLRLR